MDHLFEWELPLIKKNRIKNYSPGERRLDNPRITKYGEHRDQDQAQDPSSYVNVG